MYKEDIRLLPYNPSLNVFAIHLTLNTMSKKVLKEWQNAFTNIGKEEANRMWFLFHFRINIKKKLAIKWQDFENKFYQFLFGSCIYPTNLKFHVWKNSFGRVYILY